MRHAGARVENLPTRSGALTLHVVRTALLLSCLLTSPAALAFEVKLAVTPLEGNDVEESLRARLDDALAGELATLEMNTALVASGCALEPRCLAERGRALAAARVLAGRVSLVGEQLHIALTLVDVVTAYPSRAIEVVVAIAQAEEGLRAAASKLVAPDRYNKAASLAVNVPLTGAEVVVDGIRRGSAPMFGPVAGLAPGRRDVEVRFAGIKPWRGFIDLRFGEPHYLELHSIDGALIEVPSAAVPAPRAPSAPPSCVRPILLWSGIGTAALTIVSAGGALMAYDEAGVALGGRYPGHVTSNDVDDNRAALLAFGSLATVAIVSAVASVAFVVSSLVD